MKSQLLIIFGLVTLGYCNPVNPFVQKPKSVACDLCKNIVTQIDNLILEGSTIDAIIDAIDDICGPLENIIPGAADACETF